MVELAIRWFAAAVLVGSAVLLDRPDWDVAWRISAFAAALAVLVWVLDRRQLRGSRLACALACVDSFLVAAALGAGRLLAEGGWLAALPLVSAAVRFRASPIAMAPIAAAALVASDNWFRAETPALPLYATVGALLLAGIVGERTVAPPPALGDGEADPAPPSLEPGPGDEVEAEALEPTAYLDLRDRFRRLRDGYAELRRRSMADRVAVQLFQAALAPGENALVRIARAARQALGAEGLTLYAAAQLGDAMIVRAAAGDVPGPIQGLTVPLGRAAGDGQLRGRADAYLKALLDEDKKSQVASVVLRDGSRLLGMLTLHHRVPERLVEATERAEIATPVLALLLRHADEAERQRRRLRESELLYTISAVVRGAETAANLAARVVRELWETLTLDHVGIFLVDGEDALPLATQGAAVRMLDLLAFDGVAGLRGWLRAGAPEVVLFDARNDDRVAPEEALRRRVGSFALVAIQVGPDVIGYVSAATHAGGGIDAAETETLRVVAAELGHALARLEGRDARREGIATPAEFQEAVAASLGGCLVYLDPIRRDEAEIAFGRPAVEHALRGFARRVRARLPLGGLLCRRREGDFVAYLDGYDEAYARSWANEVAALASMIGLHTPDGKATIPLAIRAKVAVVDRARTSTGR